MNLDVEIAGIFQEAEKLVSWWNPQCDPFSPLVLDFTFPSVGTVDLLLSPFRTRDIVGEDPQSFMRSCAAYLIAVTVPCWTSIGLEVRAYDSPDGLGLEGYLNGEMVLGVDVEHHLAHIMKSVPTVMPVINGFERTGLHFNSNRTSLFAIGLMTGLSPFASGPWAGRDAGEHQGELVQALRTLAAQCADYYKRLFPEEQLGQVPELYLEDLLFPPTLMDEVLPTQRAVQQVVNFFGDNGISWTYLEELGANLAMFPDERLSMLGVALYAVQSRDPLKSQVVSVARALGSIGGLLRSTIEGARVSVTQTPDWLFHSSSWSEREQQIYKVERRLGLLPGVILDPKLLADPLVREVIASMVSFDHLQAIGQLTLIVEEQPANIEFQAQLIVLYLLIGDMRMVEEHLSRYSKDRRFSGHPFFLEQCGEFELAMGRYKEAHAAFLSAATLLSPGHMRYQEVALKQGLASLYLEDYAAVEMVLSRCDPHAELASCVVPRLYALEALGRIPELETLMEHAARMFPTDRRVFEFLYLRH